MIIEIGDPQVAIMLQYGRWFIKLFQSATSFPGPGNPQSGFSADESRHLVGSNFCDVNNSIDITGDAVRHGQFSLRRNNLARQTR